MQVNKPRAWPAYIVRELPGRHAVAAAAVTHAPEGQAMNEVAKIIEISAASPQSLEDAVQSGLRKVAVTIDKIQGAWVSDIKVRTTPGGDITEWRACLRVSFIVD
ncbi:dodecin family protein [Dyella marensis]